MTLTRLSALNGEAIVSLAAAKEHLRVTHTDEDTLIGTLRDAAIGHVERVSGVPLAPTQYRWTGAGFAQVVTLPVQLVTSVDGVTYLDEMAVAATYTGARLVNGRVYPALNESWPVTYGYAAVTFTAGLASPAYAPELTAAVKLMLGHLYRNREAVVVGTISGELPLGVAALIDTYRRVMV